MTPRQAVRRLADLAESWSVRLVPDRPNALKRAFDSIYADSRWGRSADGHGLSGPGSTLEATSQYRSFIEDLIRDEGVRSVVDAGCGDWSFSQHIDWGAAAYRGLDVVDVLVEKLQAAHEGPNIRFDQQDITDELPTADLLIVKDVLQHLPNAYIHKFIRNNLHANRYRIAVVVNDRTFDHRDNRDIRVGGFRGLDLRAEPFHLTPTEELRPFPGLAPEKVVQVFRFGDR